MLYDTFIYLVIQFIILLAVIIFYRIKNSAINDALKKQTEKLEQTSIKLNRTIEQRKFLENDRNSMQAETSKLRKVTDQMQQQLKQAAANNEELESRIQFLETYRTQSNELAGQLHEMQVLLQKSNSQLTTAGNDKQASENQLIELTQQNNALKETLLQLNKIKHQYELLAPKAEDMETELTQLKNNNTVLDSEKKQMGKQLMEQKLTIGNLEKQVSLLDTVSKKHADALSLIELLQNDLNQLKQKYEILKEANKHLQVQIAEIKELNASYKKTITVLENGKYSPTKI